MKLTIPRDERRSILGTWHPAGVSGSGSSRPFVDTQILKIM
jgi:hypothetical protein